MQRAIDRIGSSITEAVKDADDPYAESFPLLREESEATKGIGPAVWSALVDFSLEPEMVKAAVKLSQCLVVSEQARVESDEATVAGAGPLAGLKVVFTGSVAGLTRAKAKEAAKRMGAKSIGSAVSKTTDVVVAGARGGKKLQEAEKFGIRVISGEEFVNMVEEFK